MPTARTSSAPLTERLFHKARDLLEMSVDRGDIATLLLLEVLKLDFQFGLASIVVGMPLEFVVAELDLVLCAMQDIHEFP